MAASLAVGFFSNLAVRPVKDTYFKDSPLDRRNDATVAQPAPKRMHDEV